MERLGSAGASRRSQVRRVKGASSPWWRVARATAPVLALGLGLAATLAQAQEEPLIGTQPLTIPVKLVDGHPIISATVRNSAGVDEPLSFELALDEPATLLLDGDEFDWLGLDRSAIAQGKDITVRVSFGSAGVVRVPGAEVKADPSDERKNQHDRLTRRFPTQLADRKAKGVFGLGFLRHYRVTLDLNGQTLVLAPLDSSNAPAPSGAADSSLTFQLSQGRIFLPVTLSTGATSQLVLGSSEYDTRVRTSVAQELGHPTGDLGPVRLGARNDLAQLVPFRPAPWAQGKPDGYGDAAFVSGSNLLERFRLQIDWSQSVLRLTPQPVSDSFAAAHAYFAVEAQNNADAYEGFLKTYSTSRFGEEAAAKLLDLRANEWGVTDEDLLRAATWVIETMQLDRRLNVGAGCANQFARMDNRTDLTIQTALLALKYTRPAVDQQDAYRLHRLLGEQYFLKNDLDSAWKHLLSASFVTIAREPAHSFFVALDLARVYERQGRFARAYSRYKTAASFGANIPAPLKKEIDEALERLKAKIPPEQLQFLDS